MNSLRKPEAGGRLSGAPLWIPLVLPVLLLVAGCAPLPRQPSVPVVPERQVETQKLEDAVHQRVQVERSSYLENQVARLRADLAQAEESMVAIESGLRRGHTRADAVSSIAEARIAVERGAAAVPWRPDSVAEARAKLDEAQQQLDAGYAGSALFFSARAHRIAKSLIDEAKRVESSPDARFVRGSRVNLRAGPSTDDRVLEVLSANTLVMTERSVGEWSLVMTPAGQVGWVHARLLMDEP